MDQEVYIMAVDDEPLVRESLAAISRRLGYHITILDSGKAALKLISERQWSAVFLDINLPDFSVDELLEKLKGINSEIPIVVMAEPKNINQAVMALGSGAYGYLAKPFAPEEATHLINKILYFQELEKNVNRLEQRMDAMYKYEDMVGRSDRIREIFDRIQEISESDKPVMIIGEAGTGKELLARSIHARSKRRYMPFIVSEFGAMPANLIDSELFGHEKGAFTGAAFTKHGKFELAEKGTIYLDEIGSISPKTQASLLRLIEENTFRRVSGTQLLKADSRIISSSSANLAETVENGKFREDLFTRLNALSITVPPLRERTEDIPVLAEHFLQKYVAKTSKRIKRFSAGAMELIKKYPWPVNIRELKNAVERSVLHATGEEITPQELPFSLRGYLDNPSTKSIKEWEKVHIKRVLGENSWNISKTAKDLEIDRVTLYNKIKKYKLERPE